MPRHGATAGKLCVFKGREARLNKAVFQVLVLKGPQTIYDITREIKRERGFRHTNYTNASRRVRALEELNYLDKAGRRKTQAGNQAVLYMLTLRAHVAVLLNQLNPETFIKEADEDTLIAELAALILFFEKTASRFTAET